MFVMLLSVLVVLNLGRPLVLWSIVEVAKWRRSDFSYSIREATSWVPVLRYGGSVGRFEKSSSYCFERLLERP